MRLFLVDDHPVVRAGLVALLGGEHDMEVVGEAADGEDALRGIASHEPDVVLMDLQLGDGIDGVEATRRVRELPSPPQVLVLTTYETDADIVRAIDAGATGYLLKACPPEELFQGIRAAARGETVLSPRVATRMMRRMRDPGPALSAREVEILELLASGAGNREIARRLFITEATVKTHLVHIYGKLGVDTRTAAVTAAVERRLIRLA
ncbi:response regulator [Streptosporangium roseum]|uniref:Response regulator receiver protein n=1 Tax=Streptosporangium roseum (strain ATCC 12428 / DSM 43021 / JCM 3005 / KCTC 9067 / NCIMB 10171 / NRRL 2505 / NI 9100) TaxID=479432 RepID=D2B802_STRRD|nr:response regulator transcription factor [Streptosporangium roseum]ACZ83933.1 response regulator receiver protein [Streptosporangium roseum DSM 43021]